MRTMVAMSTSPVLRRLNEPFHESLRLNACSAPFATVNPEHAKALTAVPGRDRDVAFDVAALRIAKRSDKRKENVFHRIYPCLHRLCKRQLYRNDQAQKLVDRRTV